MSLAKEKYVWMESERRGIGEVFTPLCTIGYKDRTINEVEDLLIKNKVDILIDVRFNPNSKWQPEFNKKNLELYFQDKSIEYRSIPELGVDKKYRNWCAGDRDLDTLFAYYEDDLKNKVWDKVFYLSYLISKYKICLMCMEKDANKCHRLVLANYMKKFNKNISIINL